MRAVNEFERTAATKQTVHKLRLISVYLRVGTLGAMGPDQANPACSLFCARCGRCPAILPIFCRGNHYRRGNQVSHDNPWGAKRLETYDVRGCEGYRLHAEHVRGRLVVQMELSLSW